MRRANLPAMFCQSLSKALKHRCFPEKEQKREVSDADRLYRRAVRLMRSAVVLMRSN